MLAQAMKARYQYRFYPTDQQQRSLAQLFGCVRVVWNDALAVCKQSLKLPGYNKLSAMLTQAKKTEARIWLSEVSSVPLQQSLRHLDTAYKNFFNSRNGKRKGGKVEPVTRAALPSESTGVGAPRFKKKTNSQSAEFTKAAFSVKDGEVYLAKIGTIKPIWSRELPSQASSCTVIKDCANSYFLSFVVEVEPEQIQAKDQSVGIDLGIKTFATMSNGEKIQAPNYSTLDRKIRKLQRKLARQQSCSNRRNKTRLITAKLHNQVSDIRKDFLHKLSTKIVNDNQVIVLEDLCVSGMVKNRKLARAISLQGWREFRNLCEAKSEKINRDFRVIDKWQPTSQICSCCGFRWGKIDLSVRSILCLSCGTEQDRDGNAATNIEMVGMGHRHDLKRAGSDCKTVTEQRVTVNCQESPTF
ncbi:transposase [Nostoc sp. CHAB 5784]|nr:transposase [Nostoc mirabile CHAB5784]